LPSAAGSRRESAFFETHSSRNHIGTTDFRQKGYERNDWPFHVCGLAALCRLSFDWVGVGMERFSRPLFINYRFSKHPAQIPACLEAIDLREITLTRGLTEFATAA